jgi:hypothetical protein
MRQLIQIDLVAAHVKKNIPIIDDVGPIKLRQRYALLLFGKIFGGVFGLHGDDH